MKDEKEVNKLLDLHKRLKEVRAMKKSMSKDYREQIKEIEAEIEASVEELKK